MYQKKFMWNVPVLLAVALFLLLPGLLSAQTKTRPYPVKATATVDGSTTEWQADITAQNYFDSNYIAGDSTKTPLAKTYVRYDCATQTAYVLVLKEAAFTVSGSPDAWVRIQNNTETNSSPIVDQNSGDNGTPPDFAWVLSGSTRIGYEASFTIKPGYYKIEVHINIDNGSGSQTASTGKISQGEGTHFYLDCGSVIIGDKVWHDKDKDGLQDAGEPGIHNVTVTLYDWNGTTGTQVGQPTTTDDAGAYLFQALPPGTYYVRFTNIPAGYDFTTPNVGGGAVINNIPHEEIDSDVTIPGSGQTGTITLVENDVYTFLDAGLINHVSSLGDVVWLDTDKDGIQDSNEGGVDGITVQLMDGSGSVVQATKVTANGGKYLFENLAAANYRVRVQPGTYAVTLKDQGADNSLDSDVDATSPYQTASISLAQDTNDMSWDMGLYQPSPKVILGDRVWIDVDKDGLQDQGETSLAGVTVELLRNGSSLSPAKTTVTDANGNYRVELDVDTNGSNVYTLEFRGLPSGYTFTTQDVGSDNNIDSDVNTTTGRTAAVACNVAGTFLYWDAGVLTNFGSIGNYVWQDVNQDGIQNNGDSGIDGVTVQLLNSGLAVVATQVTGNGGKYLFESLAAGTYYVQVTPGTYTVSPQNAGGDDNLDSDVSVASPYRTAAISLAANQNDLSQDIGLYKVSTGTVTLGDRVWIDVDKDGLQDQGEGGLSGITVELLLNGNPLATPLTTVTDGNGNYQLVTNVDLVNTTYSLRFTGLPSGYTFTTKDVGSDNAVDSDVTPGTGRTDNFSCNVAGVYLYWDAGVLTNFSSLGNFVWFDQDRDGIQDSGEGGIDGITVQLLNSSQSVISTQTTSNGGKYLFNNLAAGSYYIQVQPSSYYVSPQDQGANNAVDSDVSTGSPYRTALITLAANTDDASWDMGLNYDQSAKVVLGDYVWFDANENGIQDAGEVPIQGVTVELLRNGNVLSPRILAVTDADGRYRIEQPISALTSWALVFYPPDDLTPNESKADNGWAASKWLVTTLNQGTSDFVDSDGAATGAATGQTANDLFNLATAGVFLQFDCGMNIKDWGDAPEPPYPTPNNTSPTAPYQDGASHTIIPGFKIGAAIDADPYTAYPSDFAVGDDSEVDDRKGDNDPGDDEDGVTFTRNLLVSGRNYGVLVAGKPEVIKVNASIPTGKQGFADVFIDYDRIHAWILNAWPLVVWNPEERVLSGHELVNGDNYVVLNISDAIDFGGGNYVDNYFRIRFSSKGALDPWGHTIDGEVEDYMVRIYKDSDGDGVPDVDETGDSDGDGTANGNDFYPGGFIYDEVTGTIISGGHITVTGPEGVVITHDGSLGFYSFVISNPGTYTLSYTPPTGYKLSSICSAQPTMLDPVPYIPTAPNPLILGQNPANTLDGRKLPTPTGSNTYCSLNTLYTSFYMQPGDQPIQLNNIPVRLEDPIAVELSSFKAVEKEGQVDVTWSMGSTAGVAGFNVYRGAVEAGPFVKVNQALIPAQNAAAYNYLDKPQQAGSYWYKLETISLDGGNEFFGPIAITLSTAVATQIIPKEFALYQNYPNPFNPQTTIRFDLPKDALVTLEIYDILGNRVRQLVSENKIAGAHSVIWNGLSDQGRQAATGMYIYRINAGDFAKTHKMIFMK